MEAVLSHDELKNGRLLARQQLPKRGANPATIRC